MVEKDATHRHIPTRADIRHVWEERYRVPKVGTPEENGWLARWQESADAAQDRRVLDRLRTRL